MTPLASFASAARILERLRIEAGGGETSLVFDLPPDVSIDLRQVKYALLVVLREGGAPGSLVANAPPPPVARPAPDAARALVPPAPPRGRHRRPPAPSADAVAPARDRERPPPSGPGPADDAVESPTPSSPRPRPRRAPRRGPGAHGPGRGGHVRSVPPALPARRACRRGHDRGATTPRPSTRGSSPPPRPRRPPRART